MTTSITNTSITTTDLTVDSADNLLKVDHATNRVGIGTITPDTVLHVNAVDPPSGIMAKFVSNGNPWIQRVGGGGSWQTGVTTNGYEFYNDTNTLYNLVISPTGNVGIGTRNPNSKLHIEGSMSHNKLSITTTANGSTGYDASIDLLSSANNSEVSINMGSNSDPDREQIKTYQSDMIFTTNAAERMRINNAGQFLLGGITNNSGGYLVKIGGSGNNGELGLTADSSAAALVSYDRSGGAYKPINIYALNTNFPNGRVGIGLSPISNSALTIGGTFINSYSSTIYLDNNNTGGADGWINTTDDSWTLKTNAGQGGVVIGTGTPQSSTARIHIGNDGTITMGKSVSGYAGTSGDSDSQLHITGPITFGHGNISEWKKGGRRVLGWWSTSYHSNGSYTHIETDLYGGSASNSDYIMGGFEIRGYRYSNPGHCHEVIGFHNWSGSLASYNVASMGNWTAGCIAYVGSNGYVYIRVPNGSYYGFIIDLYQYAWYPIRDIKVVATHQNSTANM